MKRTLLPALLAAALLSSCSDGASAAFRPVHRRGDQLVASDEPMSPEMRRNVIHVLRFYDVKHREGANGVILIPRSLASDRETLWNYTTKAEDEAWRREHPIVGAR